MGRSVDRISDATVVAYQSFGPDEEHYRAMFDDMYWMDKGDFSDWMWSLWNEEDAALEFAWILDDIFSTLEENWPSFEKTDEWIGEVHVIAQNSHSVVGVAEYNGLMSVSLAPRYDRDTYFRDDNALGEEWRKSISEKFLTIFGEYEKIGTASNGESFYQKREV